MAVNYVILLMSLAAMVVVCAGHKSYSTVRQSVDMHRRDYHMVDFAVDLDTTTFDKIINQQNVTVVMFIDYHEGAKPYSEYRKFAESTLTQPEVIAATVGVTNDYDRNNWELAERFGIGMEDLPLVKLFIRGGIEVDTLDNVPDCEKLRAFVTDNTGVWIGRAGTFEYLDKMAVEFMKEDKADEKERIVNLIRDFRNKNVTSEELRKSTDYYLRIFEEYSKKGPSFLGLEAGRLRMESAKHRSHAGNRCGLRKQQNILQTFQMSKVHLPHDEL